jgi:hypothetical protein
MGYLGRMRLVRAAAFFLGVLSSVSCTRELLVGDYDIHLAVGSLAAQADGKTPCKSTLVTVL